MGKRSTAFGETVLELTKHDFNWNRLDVEQIVHACKRRAQEEYKLFRGEKKSSLGHSDHAPDR